MKTTKSYKKKSDAEELGKAIKRKVINRTSDEESLEEIAEYVYNDQQYVNSLIRTRTINLYEDDYL